MCCGSTATNRDGVRERDVDRDEQRDDGLEFRDWRKSSRGISSDLRYEKEQIQLEIFKNSDEGTNGAKMAKDGKFQG